MRDETNSPVQGSNGVSVNQRHGLATSRVIPGYCFFAPGLPKKLTAQTVREYPALPRCGQKNAGRGMSERKR